MWFPHFLEFDRHVNETVTMFEEWLNPLVTKFEIQGGFSMPKSGLDSLIAAGVWTILTYVETYCFHHLNLHIRTDSLKVLPYIFHNNFTKFEKKKTCVQVYSNFPQLHDNVFSYFLKIHDCFEISEKLYVAGEVLINNGLNRQYFGYSIEFIIIPYEFIKKRTYHVMKCAEHNIITSSK